MRAVRDRQRSLISRRLRPTWSFDLGKSVAGHDNKRERRRPCLSGVRRARRGVAATDGAKRRGVLRVRIARRRGTPQRGQAVLVQGGGCSDLSFQSVGDAVIVHGVRFSGAPWAVSVRILPRRTRRARRTTTTDLKKISTSKLVAARQVNSGCLDGKDRYRPEIDSGGGNGKSNGRNREIASEIAVAVRLAFGIAQGVRRAVCPGARKSVRPRIDPVEAVVVVAGRPRISVQVARGRAMGRIENGIDDRRCRSLEPMDKGGKRGVGSDVVRFCRPCRKAVVLQVAGCHIDIDGEAAIRCFAIGRLWIAPKTVATPEQSPAQELSSKRLLVLVITSANQHRHSGRSLL